MLRGRILALLPLLAASLVVAACTHDFDAFEPGGADVEGGTDGGAGPVDASGDRNAADASGGQDATVDSGGDAGAVCVQTTLDACVTTQTGCISDCDKTYGTCLGKCGPPGCKQKCQNDQTTCHNACDTTCASCAGAACKCPVK